MKLKLTVILSLIVLALAGCGVADKPAGTANSNAAAPPAAATSSPAATAQSNPNMIEASSEATANTGGTKEGCKCSAVGMKCNTKDGEKGCCGGKDGSCSSKRNGVADCCMTGKDGGACCSMAKTAMADHKDMKGMSEEKTTSEAPPKKS